MYLQLQESRVCDTSVELSPISHRGGPTLVRLPVCWILDRRKSVIGGIANISPTALQCAFIRTSDHGAQSSVHSFYVAFLERNHRNHLFKFILAVQVSIGPFCDCQLLRVCHLEPKQTSELQRAALRRTHGKDIPDEGLVMHLQRHCTYRYTVRIPERKVVELTCEKFLPLACTHLRQGPRPLHRCGILQ